MLRFSWTNTTHCQTPSRYLSLSSICNHEIRDSQLICSPLNLCQFLKRLNFNADFFLSIPIKILNYIIPIPRLLLQFPDFLKRSESCMSTLRSNFPLAHFEIFSDDQHHFYIIYWILFEKILIT